MAEHSKHEIPEVEIKQNFNSSSEGYLPGSIIVGAILISASIFYNVKLVLNKLDGPAVGAGNASAQVQQQAVAPAVQPSQPQGNAPQNNTGPVTVPERKDAAVLGKANAKVTMVEFADFQCPFCQRFFNDSFGAIKSKYVDTGKVKVVFRNFPLPFHSNAQKAAEAAECAYRQGKFWEYHDLLYKNGQGDGTGLATVDLKKYADGLGLNKGTLGFGTNKFNTCLDSGAAAAVVAQDIKDGQSVGVNGTPTFFINGKQLVGAQPTAAFDQAIEEALK